MVQGTVFTGRGRNRCGFILRRAPDNIAFYILFILWFDNLAVGCGVLSD
jgi:hypothetical protein